MKRISILIAFLCLSNSLKAQSFFEKYPVYLGIDFGYIGNITYNKVEISGGNAKSITPFVGSATKQLTYNIGYRNGLNTFECSYQILKNGFYYAFDNPLDEANRVSSEIFSGNEYNDDEDMHYCAFRYYRNLSNENKKWQLNVGAGVGVAWFADLFVKSDTSNLSKGGTISNTITDKNGSRFTVNYRGDEELYRTATPCLEANIKLQRLLGEHFSFQFWARGILSPWYVRGQVFQITQTNRPSDPPRTGTAKANMNSFGLGIGIQYRF